MIKEYKNFIPQIHETCYVAPSSSIIGDVTVGENSSVWFNTVVRGDVAGIRIGQYSNIQDNSVIHCSTGLEVKVGDFVTVGHGAILHSCTIEDRCLVGMGAVILDGAKIHKNSLIGAGAVVTPNTVIPEGSLVLGSPGKVVRQLTHEEIEQILNNADTYVTLAEQYK